MTGIETIYWAIQDIVEEAAIATNEPISRDSIAFCLLDEPETRKIIRDSIKSKSPSDEQLWRKAGNYIDWLVADINGGDPRSSQWNGGHYVISRKPNKHPFSGSTRQTNWLIPSPYFDAQQADVVRRDTQIPYTERVAIVQARVGQGQFRTVD